jgi:HD-GYP domain-containing protein (c-di-GMP phosphodiesterase class II)
MQKILPGLRYHHERMNGSGYPEGLRGPDIPMMARIIAVADTFDAITTVRPYQSPMTFDEALARLNELKKNHLDEKIVEAFNQAYRMGLIRPGIVDDPAPDEEAEPALSADA